jgi:predicted transcriptional regulator of viral defense system
MDKFYNLNQREVKFISWLTYDKVKIISYQDIDKYLPKNYKYKNRFISNLIKKKIFIPIKKGIYMFVPIEALSMGTMINPYLLPKIYYPKMNYYVGYANMFNHYGLTEQIPQITYVINTAVSGKKTISKFQFQFIKVKKEYMYGLEELSTPDGKVIVSDKERTMIDFIDKWNFKDAKEKISDILINKQCDIKKFIDYAIRFPKAKTRKLAGLILDYSGIAERLLKPLCDSVKDTALISTLKSSRKGSINDKWGVISDVAY